MSSRHQVIHISLPKDLYKRIKKDAQNIGLTISGYIRATLIQSGPLRFKFNEMRKER